MRCRDLRRDALLPVELAAGLRVRRLWRAARPGKRGRGAAGKAIIAGAVETRTVAVPKARPKVGRDGAQTIGQPVGTPTPGKPPPCPAADVRPVSRNPPSPQMHFFLPMPLPNPSHRGLPHDT